MLKLLKIKVVGIVAAMGALTVLGGAVAYTHAVTQGAAPGTALQADAVPPARPDVSGGFGAERTVVLRKESSGQNFMLNLETGATLTPPPTLQGPFEKWNWLFRAGVDLMYENSNGGTLLGMDMALLPPMPAEEYDHPAADEVFKIASALLMSGSGTPSMFDLHRVPANFAFRAHDGALGMLQVATVDGDAKTITIRYRLAEPAARDAAVARLADEVVLPEMRMQIGRCGNAGGAEDIHSAIGDLVREQAILRELVKGTPAQVAVRRLETPLRMMSERMEDGDLEKARESLPNLMQAIDALPRELEKAGSQSAKDATRTGRP